MLEIGIWHKTEFVENKCIINIDRTAESKVQSGAEYQRSKTHWSDYTFQRYSREISIAHLAGAGSFHSETQRNVHRIIETICMSIQLMGKLNRISSSQCQNGLQRYLPFCIVRSNLCKTAFLSIEFEFLWYRTPTLMMKAGWREWIMQTQRSNVLHSIGQRKEEAVLSWRRQYVRF